MMIYLPSRWDTKPSGLNATNNGARWRISANEARTVVFSLLLSLSRVAGVLV